VTKAMLKRFLTLGLVLIAMLSTSVAAQPSRKRVPERAPSIEPPEQVSVLPIFLVPAGGPSPTDSQTRALEKHLEICRKRYAEMLGIRDGFRLAPGRPKVVRSRKTLAELHALPEDAAPETVATLLAELKFNRFTCPYILVTVIMNPKENWPAGGGRPLNGGFNTGGGIVILSSNGLDASPNFQSTLQHEVGHGFGLPHVDAYRYDMGNNNSIMSYNPKHHTHGFAPANEPGGLIPEDRRGLALNRRAFSGLTFDRRRDVPAGYTLADLAWIPPMDIPGQPPYAPVVTTGSGDDFGSKAQSIVGGRIFPSVPAEGDKTQTFSGKTMWQSGPAGQTGGWVFVDIKFPAAVTLTKVSVHSQHSGRFHAADQLRIEVPSREEFLPIGETALGNVDQVVPIPQSTSRTWRFWFHAADGKAVVLRGLRFFGRKGEILSPVVPFGE
jgi:hypothetical protein